MVIYSIGNFKIYQKSKQKRNDYTLLIILFIYTIFVLFLKSIWDGNPNCESPENNKNKPWIFLITPTYYRPNQIPELIRLRQSLQNIDNIFWIIVEDSDAPTDIIKHFIKTLNFKSVNLFISTPKEEKVDVANPNIHWKHHRGILQRNIGLAWLRKNFDKTKFNSGIIYFMDDDNTYDKQIFEEMRDTYKISVWPVGLVGGLFVEKPLLNVRTGRVTGFNSMWNPSSKLFPIDMAAFAINIKHITNKQNYDIYFNPNSGIGEVESNFLEDLGITISDLEPKADFCQKVLVWHTKSWPAKLDQEMKLNDQGKHSADGMILI